mgnify:CR=1 FL=1
MSESLNRLLADLHAQRVATWEPSVLQVNIDQRQRLVDEARHEDFVKVGDTLEPFTLLKVEGGSVSRDELLAAGPAVLIFFRFAGCPACNIALPYYQRRLYPQLHALGVPLLAVSPQVPERLVEIKTRHALELQVASDPDNQLGRRLGILYSFLAVPFSALMPMMTNDHGSRMPLGRRSNSSTPRSVSRLAIAALMVDCVLPSLRPAAENEPLFTTWTNISS